MHKVFALKYRPQKFCEITGQEHVVKTLENAIKLGKVAHAYLFAGPRGVGKTTTARILAKAINCQNKDKKDFEPCGKCASCIEIQKGNHPDVIEIDGASNRGINEVRGIRESVRYSPSRGKYKVYIIDEVHMLTQEAFNALLKTLEEPPSHVVFILATTAPHRVPDTILSRCQRFSFRKLREDEIIKVLQKIVKEEGIKISERAIYLISRKADGALRDAISLLEQLSSYCEGEIKEEDVKELTGTFDIKILADITDLIIEGKEKELVINLENILNSGISAHELVTEYSKYLYDMMLFKTGVKNLPKTEISYYNKKLDISQIVRMLEYCQDLERRLRDCVSPDILLTASLLEMAIFTEASIDQILKKLKEGIKVETKEEEKGLIKVWQELKKEAKASNEEWYPLIAKVEATEVEGNTLLLRCSSFIKEILSEKYLDKIKYRLKEIAGKDINLTFEIVKEEKKEELKDVEKMIIEIFDAELIESKKEV